MDFEKDYYAVLGVLPSIEPSALRAVYLALQKIYHPDVCSGSKVDAEARARAINEAYATLSDPALRAKYDAAQATKRNGSGSFAEETRDQSDDPTIDKELAEAWSYVVAYYSDAEHLRTQLQKISPALAFQFQLTIIDNKAARNARRISRQMEAEYLARYFGSSAKVREFAAEALQEGRRDVAIEVNRAISVLGSPSDEDEGLRLVRAMRSRMKFYPQGEWEVLRPRGPRDKSASGIGENDPRPSPPPSVGGEPIVLFKIFAFGMGAIFVMIASIALLHRFTTVSIG